MQHQLMDVNYVYMLLLHPYTQTRTSNK